MCHFDLVIMQSNIREFFSYFRKLFSGKSLRRRKSSSDDYQNITLSRSSLDQSSLYLQPFPVSIKFAFFRAHLDLHNLMSRQAAIVWALHIISTLKHVPVNINEKLRCHFGAETI